MTPGPALVTAEWLHVLGVTYAVDEARLLAHLPRGAQIDRLEGSRRVSLVAKCGDRYPAAAMRSGEP